MNYAVCGLFLSIALSNQWYGSPQCLLAPFVELNMAVTVALPSITTVHVLDVPEHAPDQPPNAERLSALAVSFTLVPCLKVDPEGLLVIVPLPAPLFVTVSV